MADRYKIIEGDCSASLRSMPAGSVHCCVTSPPYWGLRDYGNDGQIGLEATPDEYVARMVAVFREVRRVLRDDGTLWLNLGDTYAGYHGNKRVPDDEAPSNKPGYIENMRSSTVGVSGLKQKDLVGIPWRVAFALQADGWYLRQDIIWAKINPMPESVRDRCTKAHEYVFLLSKSARYFYDADAISERAVAPGCRVGTPYSALSGRNDSTTQKTYTGNANRNKRSVWTIATAPYKGAHFAVFPPKLIEPCILAGCPVGGTVLDPFGGAGTTAVVALQNQRKAVLCELNGAYIELAHKRIKQATAQVSIFDLLGAA